VNAARAQAGSGRMLRAQGVTAYRGGMRTANARWAFSGIVAVAAVLLTWILTGESSPLAGYFLSNVGVPNAWRLFNAVPFIVAAVISGNPGGGPAVLFTVLQLAQWFLIAYGLSTLVSRVRTPKR
jgi:hypothetical protein